MTISLFSYGSFDFYQNILLIYFHSPNQGEQLCEDFLLLNTIFVGKVILPADGLVSVSIVEN
jgi:hypothetical protein